MADLPQALKSAIEEMTAARDQAQLARDAQTISENYRLRTGNGARLLTKESEAAAYAASRMPATFGAAHAALGEALAATGLAPKTLLDCGAGTGAMTFAADSLLALERVTCLEREDAMRAVGSRLMQMAGSDALQRAVWTSCDLAKDEALPAADLVCEGYMLGELPEGMREGVARRLWQAAGQMLLLVEPGTPQGFANLRRIRSLLVSQGAHVAAPCPAGAGDCPMAGEDWCHFAVRVQRTKLHKALKDGAAPYEDEKFCYLALTKQPPEAPCAARVLRHPQIAPGRISLTLCETGMVNNRVVTKKDPLWKRARKIGAGDAI